MEINGPGCVDRAVMRSHEVGYVNNLENSFVCAALNLRTVRHLEMLTN